MRTRDKRFFLFILGLILLLHGGVLFLTYRVSERKLARDQTRAEKTIRVEVKKSKNLFSDQFKQIVQSENPDEFMRPEDSRFLSDKNRKFDRQTMARKVDIFEKSSRGKVSLTFEGKAEEASPKKVPKKEISLSDLGHPADRHPLKLAAEKYAKRGAKHVPDEGRSVSSTNDYVEDVPLGDLTHLNTQEYIYYGFYHRIRQKLEQFWGKSIRETAEQLSKSGRMIASENVITALRVTLDEMGEILAISVIGPSGISELDDAAIKSFNQAGPFPNPPKGMIVEGKVVLEWGFVVKT